MKALSIIGIILSPILFLVLAVTAGKLDCYSYDGMGALFLTNNVVFGIEWIILLAFCFTLLTLSLSIVLLISSIRIKRIKSK